jgi:hypothetical protein
VLSDCRLWHSWWSFFSHSCTLLSTILIPHNYFHASLAFIQLHNCWCVNEKLCHLIATADIISVCVHKHLLLYFIFELMLIFNSTQKWIIFYSEKLKWKLLPQVLKHTHAHAERNECLKKTEWGIKSITDTKWKLKILQK